MRRATSFAIALTFFSSVASAQQPCTTDARRVVDEVYRHMLERGADAGSQNWQTQLQNGQITVRDLVRAVAKSQEHNQRFIKQENGEEMPFIRSVSTLYRHILGRQPDAEGARANAQSVANQGIGPVIDSIINSAEYTQRYGDWGVPGSGGVFLCAPGNRSASSTPAPVAPVPQNSDARFRNMDRNNDGAVTQDEWRGNRGGFQMRDWNGDGVLSGDEMQANAIPPRRRSADTNFDSQEDRFGYLDSNRNGRIELREWTSTDATFNRLDLNRDGTLSRAELSGNDNGAVATSGNGRYNNGNGRFGNDQNNGRFGNDNDNGLVYVDANQRWTDTGIDIQAGETIVVDAQGSIQLSADANDSATPAGSRSGRRAAQAPVRQGPAGGLIGRVGNGTSTFLGQRGSMRASTSGRLYLSVNDDYLEDNSGEYRVNITVR